MIKLTTTIQIRRAEIADTAVLADGEPAIYRQTGWALLFKIGDGVTQWSNLPTLNFSADNLNTAVNAALAQAKESGDFDGADGYTPIRGTDYWTEADKAEIKSYVDEAILNGEW